MLFVEFNMDDALNVRFEEGVEQGIGIGVERGIERGIGIGVERGIGIGVEQGIGIGVEQGIGQGLEIGKEQKEEEMNINMIRNSLPVDLIATISKLSTDKVARVIEKYTGTLD
jgi:hypothetical protein